MTGTDTTPTTKYPLDFSALEKGQLVLQEDIERITGVSKSENPEDYQLEVLNLTQRIMKETAELGLFMTAKGDKGAIRILTDEEAVEYHASQCESGRKKSIRNMARMQINVDVRNLSEDSKARHERNLVKEGIYLSMVNKAREEIRLLPENGT